MRKKQIIIILLSCLWLSQCSHKQLYDPTFWSKSFKGITFTDEFGAILGGDNSDWCYHSPSDMMYLNGPIPIFFVFGPVYPNPARHKAIIHIPFQLPRTEFCQVYVIDEDYKIITTLVKMQMAPGKYQVDWQLQNTLPGTYRIIFDSENFHCQGDVWIQ